ncbi:metallophosphoesterase [Tardiphaga sp. 813_E8_N1_3]|uniref:metallophosphoesterase n=1 Tax=Tardiphaga sp. 813_E8_N1_3 TaxID=3240760 RepID=UPI003F24B330
MATFLIADQHYGHSAIIQMCNRPFGDVHEMNEALVAGHNAVVAKDDTVIMLGDFAHRYPAAKLPLLFGSLNGHKHLIRGNYDDKHTLALPWESVRDIAYASIDSQNVVLCHYALRTWPKIRKGALMLHGHSHGRLPGNVQSCDIGVDVMGWSPVRLSTIKEHLATLPVMNNPEARDDIEDMDVGGLKL